MRISALTGRVVLLFKKTAKAKDGTLTDVYSKLGRVHNAVFDPSGKRLVGIMVKRGDIAGMVKRDDAFVAWDALDEQGKDLLVTRPKDGMDAAARKRLCLDWDACIIWSGMDAKTTDGKSLGYVSDVEFDERDGRVGRFFTSDGGTARALVGEFVITPDMVRGYARGYMVVDTGGRRVELDGGLAGAAGEGYARAKAKGSEVGKKVGAAAGEAVEKGSFALGRALGKAKRAIADAAAPEQEPAGEPVPALDVRVEQPTRAIPEQAADPADAPARPAPKTYAPKNAGAGATAQKAASKQGAASAKATPKAAGSAKAASRPPTKKQPTTGDKVARAAGRQLSGLGKMFGSFKDEFDKASKGQ